MALVTVLSTAARKLFKIVNNHLAVLTPQETTIFNQVRSDIREILREDDEADIVRLVRTALETAPTTKQELIDAINAV